MSGWTTLSSKLIHETHWLRLVEDKVLDQNQKPLTYTYMVKDPSVCIVVVDEHGGILLQRQFIYPIKKTLWVLPAGFCEKGEEPLAAAKRELTEEAGIESAEWHELGMSYSASGVSHNIGYGFVAKITKPSLTVLDEEEDVLEQRFFTPDEVKKMLQNQEIVDGFSLVPLYTYLFSKLSEVDG